MKKMHPLWGVHCCLNMVSTRTCVRLPPISSFLTYLLGGPLARDGAYFCRLWAQFFQMGRRWSLSSPISHMISKYLQPTLNKSDNLRVTFSIILSKFGQHPPPPPQHDPLCTRPDISTSAQLSNHGKSHTNKQTKHTSHYFGMHYFKTYLIFAIKLHDDGLHFFLTCVLAE